MVSRCGACTSCKIWRCDIDFFFRKTFTSGRISLFTPQQNDGSKAKEQGKESEFLWKTKFREVSVGRINSEGCHKNSESLA